MISDGGEVETINMNGDLLWLKCSQAELLNCGCHNSLGTITSFFYFIFFRHLGKFLRKFFLFVFLSFGINWPFYTSSGQVWQDDLATPIKVALCPFSCLSVCSCLSRPPTPPSPSLQSGSYFWPSSMNLQGQIEGLGGPFSICICLISLFIFIYVFGSF